MGKAVGAEWVEGERKIINRLRVRGDSEWREEEDVKRGQKS